MRQYFLQTLCAILLLASQAAATWSIVVVNLATGEVAIATATCIEGVNMRKLTPVILPGIGAATAQSMVDTWGSRVMIHDGMLAGDSLEKILLDLEVADVRHQLRQYGMVNMNGEALTFTGTSAGSWAGGVTGHSGDLVYAIQGNVLTDPLVVSAAEQALLQTSGDLGQKIMASMEAAASFGGDGRCSCNMSQPTSCGAPPPGSFKSAHIGCFIIARMGEELTSCTTNQGCAKGDFYLTINERDLFASDLDPVVLMRQDYDVWRQSMAGIPDAIHSEVVAPVEQVRADQSQILTYVLSLADINQQWIAQGGASISLEHSGQSQVFATLQSVTDHQDGTYSVDVLTADAPGLDELLFVVDGGSGPVTLWPPARLVHTPWLEVGALISGQTATLSVTGAGINTHILFAYSVAGPGPSMTPLGMVDLSPPIVHLATLPADAQGNAAFATAIPPGFSGISVWTQSGVMDAVGVQLTNAEALILE